MSSSADESARSGRFDRITDFVVYRTDRRGNQADAVILVRVFRARRMRFARAPIGLERTTRRSLMVFPADLSPSDARPTQEFELPQHHCL
jgi:hypothetical protein